MEVINMTTPTLDRALCEALGIKPIVVWMDDGEHWSQSAHTSRYPNLSTWDGMRLLVEALTKKGYILQTRVTASWTSVEIIRGQTGWRKTTGAQEAPAAVRQAAAEVLGITTPIYDESGFTSGAGQGGDE